MIDEKVILLVEDNAGDQELTLLSLRRSKVLNKVVVAHDGVEALDYLFSRGAEGTRKPDLPAMVLLDLKLPKVDGLEVLRRIRSEPSTRLLPVVIFTSSNEERDMLESYSSGCNSYVRKPVDFEQFSDAVRQLGLYWVVVNEAPPDQRA
jgi:two-component system response regulator